MEDAVNVDLFKFLIKESSTFLMDCTLLLLFFNPCVTVSIFSINGGYAVAGF